MTVNIKKLFGTICDKLKNKRSLDRVWPFLLCILLAFVVWFYVMYVQAPEYEYTYEDIPVTIKNIPPMFADYKIKANETSITAKFRGTNMNLAKCGDGDIKAVLDLSSVVSAGLANISITYEYPSGVTLTCVDNISMWVNIVAPQSRYFKGIPVVIAKNGEIGIDEVDGYSLVALPETVEAYITSTDDSFQLIDPGSIMAVADISNLAITAPGSYSSIQLQFVSDAGVEINGPNIFIEIIAEKTEN